MFPAWIRALSGKSGVYIVKRKDSGNVVYVGESHTGRLRETLTRHFQSWSGRTAGPTWPPSAVIVSVIVTPPSKAVAEQNRWIAVYMPRTNTNAKPSKSARARVSDDDKNPFG